MRFADLSDDRVQSVVAAAAAAGVEIAPVMFERGTRTSADAAREIGCSVEEIVKSLVFGVMGTQQAVMLLLSGADRVDLPRAAAALGVDELERAAPEFAKRITGYSIGATPPFGHKSLVRVAMDDRLLDLEHVWAAGGRPDTVFRIASEDLMRVSNAIVVRLREE
jgi:prolyl-tRNA editing enzyme YbaK/EbsC (Cys-tRNA(Pro) deacylase)